MGLDRAEVQRVLGYLAEKGLVKVDDFHTGVVRLTAAGVDWVEVEGPVSPEPGRNLGPAGP
jgi:hypothetical protein